MKERVLDVFVGRVAKERIEKEGWDPSIFSLLLGASGGPKWLVLSQIDRVLFGEFLPKREKALDILGTSIGSWRHACLGQKDPLAAIKRMEEHYIHQSYSANPSPHEVTVASRDILKQVLGKNGAQEIVENQRYTTHIGTVRGKGLIASKNQTLHTVGLAFAAFGNAVHRSWLQPSYQRVMFSGDGSGEGSGMAFKDFSTVYTALTQENAFEALMASASIPLVLEGVSDPPGAPKGLYWDGGIVDYHHDLRAYQGDGLVLYPHFYNYIVPGWFDKSFKGRRPKGDILEKVVQISPSQSFVDALPGAKIPDRKDFKNLDTEERFRVWWEVVSRCEALGDALRKLLAQSNPLEGVQVFS